MANFVGARKPSWETETEDSARGEKTTQMSSGLTISLPRINQNPEVVPGGAPPPNYLVHMHEEKHGGRPLEEG